MKELIIFGAILGLLGGVLFGTVLQTTKNQQNIGLLQSNIEGLQVAVIQLQRMQMSFTEHNLSVDLTDVKNMTEEELIKFNQGIQMIADIVNEDNRNRDKQ